MNNFEQNTEETKDVDQWLIGGQSSVSIESSILFYQLHDYDLQLIQKKESPSERPMIPATKMQRLSYYRMYVSTPNKIQQVCIQFLRFYGLLWFYIFNTILKSLSHTYVHIFLASYAAEDHMFISKMLPILCGNNVSIVIASLLEILGLIDIAILWLDYTICGFAFKNPWNRCDSNVTYVDNQTVHCFTTQDFSNMMKNMTPVFREYAYLAPDNQLFQLSQIEYHRKRYFEQSQVFIRSTAYFCLIWVLAALFYKQVSTKYFWKVLDLVQWGVNSIDLVCFLYLIIHCNVNDITHYDSDVESDSTSDRLMVYMLWFAYIDILAESTTAPPVVHVLTARGIGSIEPGRDSAILVTSNAVLYLLRGLLYHKFKIYNQSVVHAPIFPHKFSSWISIWPIFFSTLYLGDLYILICLAMNLMMGLMVVIVTYHCLIEVIVWEWKQLGRRLVVTSLTVTGTLLYVLTTPSDRVFLYISGKALITLIEAVVFFWLYPVGRLKDDITFHYGVPPTKLRTISMKLVPAYFMIKFIIIILTLQTVISDTSLKIFSNYFQWFWAFIMVPILIGVIWTLIICIIKRKNWLLMFRPDPNWGPKDFLVRQLRKEFDSREYVGSQAPRLLSRYFLAKTEPKSYKLDVRYESVSRHSTAPPLADAVNIDNEKKRM